MKVVFLNEKNLVTKIFTDVYEPRIKDNKIVHDNGKIYGLEAVDDFIIVEDHIPVYVGEFVSESIYDYDKKDKLDDDDNILEEVKDKIEEVGEDIKETLTNDNDNDNDDTNRGGGYY